VLRKHFVILPDTLLSNYYFDKVSSAVHSFKILKIFEFKRNKLGMKCFGEGDLELLLPSF
jgi:hypothetical protein